MCATAEQAFRLTSFPILSVYVIDWCIRIVYFIDVLVGCRDGDDYHAIIEQINSLCICYYESIISLRFS